MTGDLVTFLRARLDEREAKAQAVVQDSAPGETWWTADGLSDTDLWNLPAVDAVFIADNDPAFVLADVAAKRLIIELHPCAGTDIGEPFCVTCTSDGDLYGEDLTGKWPCTTLRLLALPDAGHKDYRQEWGL